MPTNNGEKIEVDALLWAIERHANIEGLGLEERRHPHYWPRQRRGHPRLRRRGQDGCDQGRPRQHNCDSPDVCRRYVTTSACLNVQVRD